MVERLAVKHYSQNVNKGAEIIEYHINELAKEDITYIAPYESFTVNQPSTESITDDAGEHLANGDDDDTAACNNPKHAHLKPCNGEKMTKTTDKNKNVVINSFAANKKGESGGEQTEQPTEDELDESKHNNNIKNGHLKQSTIV